jgi:tripartite-type tricarboxylate transporter receptor subunit TctC
MKQRTTTRRSSATRVLVPLLGLAAAGCSGAGGGDAATSGGATGASCYEGKNATFVVPYAPGGGYDTIARGLGPALEEELGATVIIENQPGAGGLTAANTLFSDKPDGLTFAILPSVGILGASLAELQGAGFDATKFSFVARVAPDERLLSVGPDSGIETLEDLVAKGDVQFSSTGPGGADHVDATVVSAIFGLTGEVVSGFAGSGETYLAVTTGDVDAVISSVAGQLSSVDSGDLVPVMAVSEERVQDLPDVPALLELELDDEQRALAEAHARLQQAGRAVVAPPGVSDACVTELEAAFKAAVEDPEVKALLEKSDEHLGFLSGNELEETYRTVLEDSPEDYVALLKKAFAGQ